MTGTEDFVPQGVIPACLMPFDASFEIDQTAYRTHLRDLAGVEGIAAITINGHASEVHALSFEEQQRSLDLARDELGGALPIVVGIWADSSLEASRLARMAETAGADGLLILPPGSMNWGGQLRPEMAREHFDRIANATRLPLILFQYPLSSGLGYPFDTLIELCQQVPTLRAIKDWCNDPALHERHIRELHGLTCPVSVLSTHSAWLLASLVLGCDGLLSGAGSVIANLHVALVRAVKGKDLKTAQAINDMIYPTVRAFYREPFLDMHNRMKEALVLLGRLESAHVRPPLMKLSKEEIQSIAARLEEAGVTQDTVYLPVPLKNQPGTRIAALS